MNNNNIIIILLAIIVVMLAGMHFMFNPFAAGSNVSITSNGELYKGDAFSISLTDNNGAPIPNQIVNVKFSDSVTQQITTDSSSNGMIELNGLSPGKYNVSVEYKGNGNYSSSSASQALTVSEATTTSAGQSQSSSASSSSDTITI